MGTLSKCLKKKFYQKEKMTLSLQAIEVSQNWIDQDLKQLFSWHDSFKQIFMVSSREMLVNNKVMLRIAVKQSEFSWSIFSVKSYEPLTLYSWEAKSVTIGTKNLTTLYVGVPLAKGIRRKAG